MEQKKLKILKPEEYRFIEDKDPEGIYDQKMREDLYWIIEKLGKGIRKGSYAESRLYKRFRNADFGFLLGKNKGTETSVARIFPYFYLKFNNLLFLWEARIN